MKNDSSGTVSTSTDTSHAQTHRGSDADQIQVSGEAQGDASALDKFVKELNQGPSAAQVSKVDQKDIPTQDGESGFHTKG